MRNERFNDFEEVTRVLKHPYNRWESGGPILYYHNGIPYYYDKEGHILYIGRSGMGKTFYGIENQVASLINSKQSFILPVTKGDMLKKMCALLSKDYDVRVIDFRDLTNSPGFNPLTYPFHLYKSGEPAKVQLAKEILDELAFGFYPDERSKDPFWENSARTMFIALAELLLEHSESEEEVNLYNLYRMVMQGDEKFAGSNYLKEWVNFEPESSVARMNLQSYVNAPSETKGGMRCVYFNGLNPYIRSDAVVSMLSNDNLMIEKLDGETPTAILIGLPDETPIYNTICGCLLSQLIRHYIKLAETKYNGTLPIKMHIVIDELASVAHSIPNLDYLLSASRSRGITITGVLQSLSQLEDVYGKAKAETIISNFGVTIAFSTNNFDTLQELSRRCGERRNRHGQVEPLITPVQLGAMGIGQALIIIENRYRYITNLPNFNEVFGNVVDFSSCDKIKVERKPIKIFDIQERVKKRKSESMSTDSVKNNSFPPFFNRTEPKDVYMGQNEEQSSGIDVSELLAKIDAKIAELEEAERLENEKEKASEKDKKYWVEITKIPGDVPEAAIALFENLGTMDILECDIGLRFLPFKISFSHKEEAEKFIKAMNENHIETNSNI